MQTDWNHIIGYELDSGIDKALPDVVANSEKVSLSPRHAMELGTGTGVRESYQGEVHHPVTSDLGTTVDDSIPIEFRPDHELCIVQVPSRSSVTVRQLAMRVLEEALPITMRPVPPVRGRMYELVDEMARDESEVFVIAGGGEIVSLEERDDSLSTANTSHMPPLNLATIYPHPVEAYGSEGFYYSGKRLQLPEFETPLREYILQAVESTVYPERA